MSYAVVPTELSALATAYVLIMAILGPIAAKFVEPVAKALQVRRTAAQPSPTVGQ